MKNATYMKTTDDLLLPTNFFNLNFRMHFCNMQSEPYTKQGYGPQVTRQNKTCLLQEVSDGNRRPVCGVQFG